MFSQLGNTDITVIKHGFKASLHKSLFWVLLQGEDDNMCPAVTHSCRPLKWCPGWVQSLVPGCSAAPEVAPSIGLWQCRNPVKYQCVLGFTPLPCHYWSYIIETLGLQHFLLLKESMSLGVKLPAAREEKWMYKFWRRQKQICLDEDERFQSGNYCTCLWIFPRSLEKLDVFFLIGQVEYVSFVCGDTFFIARAGEANLALPSALNNRDETTWWIHLSAGRCGSQDFNNGCCISLWWMFGLSSVIWKGVSCRERSSSLIKEALGRAVTHG